MNSKLQWTQRTDCGYISGTRPAQSGRTEMKNKKKKNSQGNWSRTEMQTRDHQSIKHSVNSMFDHRVSLTTLLQSMMLSF